MPRYYITYVHKLEDGSEYHKWIPSTDYSQIEERLLDEMKRSAQAEEWYVIPFVLTLCAELESHLNDSLIIDSFRKHGPDSYESIVKGYLRIPFGSKMRAVVAILTDNHFQIKEGTSTIQALDKLISARNKIAHTQALFFREDRDEKKSKAHDLVNKHPIYDLDLKSCQQYYEAVKDFHDKFFKQYDKGVIDGNELLTYIGRKARDEPA